MANEFRRYEGEALDILYDPRRCIHAEECVHGLPGVFDPRRRPWIDPAGGDAERIARVVGRCPTGALRYEPRGDLAPEPTPDENVVTVAADGPLYARGDLEIVTAAGDTVRETRAALCRCGHSKRKPYCDNSHLEVPFEDPGDVAGPRLRSEEGAEPGSLQIKAAPDGPLLLAGPVEIVSAAGEAADQGVRGALCRCGASAVKPYCDGTHKAIGFEAD